MARVLLVECNQQVRHLLCGLIRDAGHHVDCVMTKNEALESLETGNHALVVTDATLPDGSGHDVAKRAAELGIKIILMTGHPDRVREMVERKIPHLQKPFRIDIFEALMERHLA